MCGACLAGDGEVGGEEGGVGGPGVRQQPVGQGLRGGLQAPAPQVVRRQAEGRPRPYQRRACARAPSHRLGGLKQREGGEFKLSHSRG